MVPRSRSSSKFKVKYNGYISQKMAILGAFVFHKHILFSSGTIVYVPKEGSSSDKVTVIWDSGRELRYRAGVDGKYDLCLLDNSPTGLNFARNLCVLCEHITI